MDASSAQKSAVKTIFDDRNGKVLIIEKSQKQKKSSKDITLMVGQQTLENFDIKGIV